MDRRRSTWRERGTERPRRGQDRAQRGERGRERGGMTDELMSVSSWVAVQCVERGSLLGGVVCGGCGWGGVSGTERGPPSDVHVAPPPHGRMQWVVSPRHAQRETLWSRSHQR